ncbi:transcriptional regulator, IclR family [Palleronia marisminoris]|uniref:HTH-type transcriptional repressor AllR n=1 Tax=Palleronia marisminoris TaxID=315423 RepID=A0A1Y5S494_9RHOB|nr:IclR family transcriptional regulator [Palleronia marisminoris]SFG62672.1 transcriptional regulator, IclR family [Palleronia marisminoris]SLN31857.1 HTH-type transcriptional repressor AllR [Palleronia marisminoris]
MNRMTGPSGAQSVDRALLLLRLVGPRGEDGASLVDLVTASGLEKPTVRRLLMALMRSRLIEQDPATRHYHLGEECYVLGALASPRHGLLEIAADAVARLARDSGDTAFVTMRRGSFAICLHRQEGSYPIRTHALTAGAQHPLGVGAGSLAMLAALPDAEVEAVLADISPHLPADYPDYAPHILRADIERTRARGHALNPGRIVAGSWGIGVALRRGDGTVAGALSLAAVESRMQPPREAELAALLAREAAEVETRLRRERP